LIKFFNDYLIGYKNNKIIKLLNKYLNQFVNIYIVKKTLIL